MLRRIFFGLAVAVLMLSFAGAQLSTIQAQQTSLLVSAAGTGDKFFGPQIVQVVVDGAGIRDPDTAPGSLLVNGVNVPLVHLGDSRWYAFVADRDTFTLLAGDAKLPGKEISASGKAFWAVGPSDKSLLFPTLPRAFGHDSTAGTPLNPNIDLDGDCPAVVAESDACVEWPYIALFSFSENDLVSFRHSGQSVTLKYIRPSPDDIRISLDRDAYPSGAEIILTLADYMWNINPVEEDRVHFAFSGKTEVFYQASFALAPASITGILGSLGFRGDQVLETEEIESIEFANTIGGMPETVLIETSPNSGVLENIEARADMFAKGRNALITFEYLGKSTASSTSTGDASVSIGKEKPEEPEEPEKEPEKGDQVPEDEVTAPAPEPYSMSEPGLADLFGKRIERVVTGAPLIVETNIRNNLEEEQPFVYIVQIKDSDGFTEMLTWIKGRMGSSSTLDPGISWTPEKSGKYEVHVFIWKSFEDPGLPLERVLTLTAED